MDMAGNLHLLVPVLHGPTGPRPAAWPGVIRFQLQEAEVIFLALKVIKAQFKKRTLNRSHQ